MFWEFSDLSEELDAGRGENSAFPAERDRKRGRMRLSASRRGRLIVMGRMSESGGVLGCGVMRNWSEEEWQTG